MSDGQVAQLVDTARESALLGTAKHSRPQWAEGLASVCPTKQTTACSYHKAMHARMPMAAYACWRLHQRCASSPAIRKEPTDLVSGHGSELHVWHGRQVDRK